MVEEALAECHKYKTAITSAGGRIGKRSKVIDNWHIPKLEFLQSVVPNIRDNGVAIQWSADVTERAHVTEIKNPTSSTNNQNYEWQICRHLDRAEKCQRFDLATAVHEVYIDFQTIDDGTGMAGEIGESDDDDNDNDFDLDCDNSSSSFCHCAYKATFWNYSNNWQLLCTCTCPSTRLIP
jgi:hypothetical protein